MKRAVLFSLVIVLAFAEASRDAYRNAYKSWREADPTLERDAARATPAFGADADRVANQAAKYGAAFYNFLNESARETQNRLAWLEQAAPPAPAPDPAPARVVASETAAVRRGLDIYGKDPDPGIKLVRNMLERENLALASIGSKLSDTQKSSDAVKNASAAEDQARLKALALEREVTAAARRRVDEANQEAAAWAEYYRLLSDNAREATPPPPTALAGAPPAAALHTPPATAGVPLARYIGAWTYPASNGLFHGIEPEFVDLVVHEENGHADGTLFGRFKVASGDPELRFDFSGEFRTARTQVFNLETSDGANGTMELIPGPAFNLLEVNFQVEAKPGKIHVANFMLVKK